jgi:GLPGLI family protein
MKTISIKFSLVTCLLFFISNNAKAQEFQGKAYYKTKTTMDMDNFGGRDMSPERKKQIAERMKSFLEKTYVLTFNKTESIYKEDEKLEAPGGGGGGRFFGMMGSMSGGPQYKNVKDKLSVQEQEFFGKQFLVKDELTNLEWTMGTETKQIGKYLCFKATAKKPVEGFDFSSFRRRNNNETKDAAEAKDSTKTDNPIDEIEMPKEIEVVAWYTPQIPINQGPAEYWGLPGLILEISAARTTILCSKIVMNPEEIEDIKVLTKGKEVTKAEYKDIVAKKTKEMRENFSRGRNRGGNFRRN